MYKTRQKIVTDSFYILPEPIKGIHFPKIPRFSKVGFPIFSSTWQSSVGACGGRGKFTPKKSDSGMGYSYDSNAIQAHITVSGTRISKTAKENRLLVSLGIDYHGGDDVVINGDIFSMVFHLATSSTD
ncbi:MAG: hypothetical protein OXC82_06535 [Rhodobacteraceae bacterium]|nr:hypothetical protein [Paracoccaceae bacterium]MCY4250075.1 hypothetical protein [Paracoccaceae bacterium]